jgi:xanthine dehydrogenase YagS FAD-binding subunit
MRAFSYERAASFDAARDAIARPGAAILAGGTTLLDLAKLGVTRPEAVVDISRLAGLDAVMVTEDGAEIGALARMARVAADPAIRRHFPAVAEALALSASPQIRTMATIGGNLMQRTRCAYFRDPARNPGCNRRAPGSGCAAIGGATRNHAVLGTSPHCIATHPGDLAVALVALDATIEIGDRWVPAAEFLLTPDTDAAREFAIAPHEIITAVTIPASPVATRSTYLKVRDRASYEFAAASAAVGLELEADGRTIRRVAAALGGVATIPWRVPAVEQALVGKTLTEATVRSACGLAMEGAVPQGANAYKIELAPRVLARAILSLGGIA